MYTFADFKYNCSGAIGAIGKAEENCFGFSKHHCSLFAPCRITHTCFKIKSPHCQCGLYILKAILFLFLLPE
jgi:hypothetical protein